ncbi:tropomyosin alpha-1 chain-like protein [Labeo rohita]|uniref:Tropomyosin alpha-1 chain-like protein n=1 Tax=Labeo rohita TaxID=84645 RepID=A0A498MGI1_LABRO|nr:tropomyosin alpha-1 chain-like protein [Labeo rohita]
MSHATDPVSHWEDLETWLSAVTDSLLPRAAESLRQQTQDQLDDNITSIMRQDPNQSYNHKELAKITGSLSHTLIATLKLSDRHSAHLQQELTRAQRRIEQLELEAQDRQEGSEEADPSAKEEIARLRETLTTTSQEREQAKSDYTEVANKLQYAEQLLEKAKLDLRDKNGRIKVLETHLREARTEISYLMQQLDHIKEESDSVKDELKHAYELRPEQTRTRRAPNSPLQSRTGFPVPGLTRGREQP